MIISYRNREVKVTAIKKKGKSTRYSTVIGGIPEEGNFVQIERKFKNHVDSEFLDEFSNIEDSGNDAYLFGGY